VYLADFGLSRRLDDQVGESGQDRSLGTPAYVAPEQLEGLALDGRADVYSLGCLLYECLTGERVFPRDSRLAEAWAHLEEEPPRPSRRRPGLPDTLDNVISRALAKKPEERYPTCGALIAAAESALGLRRPPRLGNRARVAIAAAVVALATSLAVTFVVLDASGSTASPPTHPNTIVGIDPHTNKVERVIDVPSDPAATAAWGHTLWVYSSRSKVVTEVDARTNRKLHTTPVSVTLPDLQPGSEGPLMAADKNGAWLVGIDRPGRSWLTHVLPSGRRRRIALPGSPEAVDTGLRAVWVIDRGAPDRLLRLDPATGTITEQKQLPAQVDSLTVGYGYVWLVNSAAAILYRINPRLAASRPYDLACYEPQVECTESSTGQPSAVFGQVYVWVAANGGTVTIDPRTLLTDDIPAPAFANGVVVEAFDAAWTYDDYGDVLWWNSPDPYPAAVINVTKSPSLDRSCLTSIAPAGDAVWVTLAPSVDHTCKP
jgi:hypothetical protein